MSELRAFVDDRVKCHLRHPDSEDRMLNSIISDISIVQRETTLTISDSIETGSNVETEIVRVVSLSTTEITEITRLKTKQKNNNKKKKLSLESRYLKILNLYLDG